MVEKSTNNINSFIKSSLFKNKENLKINLIIEKLNSKFINESDILKNKKIDSIVSE
jgi:hypothetical protein